MEDIPRPASNAANDNAAASVRRRVFERLALARAKLRLSEQQMADAMGVCLRTYKKYECLKGPKSIQPLLELADFIEREQPRARPLFLDWVAGMDTFELALRPMLKLAHRVR